MTSRVQPASSRAIDLGDWVITLILLVVMVGAYVLTLSWPANAAFFPRALTAAGTALILVKIGMLTRDLLSPRPPAIDASSDADGPRGLSNESESGAVIFIADVDEDQGNEDESHRVFVRADRRMWGAVVGWLGLFFAGIYLVGILITLPVFTVLYLRTVAKSSWLSCILYVAGTAGVIYVLFDLILHLPLPRGVLAIAGE